MTHKTPLIVAALLLCTVLPGTALAADAGESAPLYPSEIVEYGEEDTPRLDKIYNLAEADDPAGIPTEDFEREGFHYTLLDLTRQEQTETDAKLHTETITLNSKSKDMSTILPLLESTRDVTTEDGYTGVLTLDTASIKTEAAGYGSSTKAVSATRSYPNLSDADTSLIPKTIEDNGRTLTLGDVQWQEAGEFFDATATYTGTATSTYATGYTVTANYTGEVSKTTTDTVLYRGTFGGTPIAPIQEEPEDSQEPEAQHVVWSWDWHTVLPVAGGAAGMALLGVFAGHKLRPKKEWRELPE